MKVRQISKKLVDGKKVAIDIIEGEPDPDWVRAFNSINCDEPRLTMHDFSLLLRDRVKPSPYFHPPRILQYLPDHK